MKRKAMGWVVAGAVMLAVACQVSAQPSPGSDSGVAASGAESNIKATKAANRKLRRDVLRALAKTPGLNNERISVRANGGAVTLSGSVPVADQIQKAGDAARQVSGVSSLSNRITLRSYN
ncbi:BON domain-containing protein [Paraburkholderia unamae]|uniref:BON domain-containing protein n=1 Tax=Paraburkholderia unamae TaxID=219649 RepID=UPI000DC2A534|nr:BON domain-containing protein [Paraburkholderia unamae]RAR53337.1 BON domain-containing protein [Paraburkholderia unamae]